MGFRKALVVGINNYDGCKLNGCVRDAKSVSKLICNNDDGSCNFDTQLLLDDNATADNIRSKLKETFGKSEYEVGLLYFSGHGFDDKNDGSIVSFDKQKIKFRDLMDFINGSKCQNKIIVLDCCFSGKFGDYSIIGDNTIIGKNTIIFTACSNDESAYEINGKGVFSELFIDGLSGGAADILGNVTPGSLYAYIDKALNSWEQRPFFKANVSSFISLRKCKSSVEISEIQSAMRLFKSKNSIFKLDPSFEYTTESANPTNVKKFKLLQKMNRNGLILPIDEEYMYNAAMNSKGCKLTKLGQHYWKLVKENKIK